MSIPLHCRINVFPCSTRSLSSSSSSSSSLSGCSDCSDCSDSSDLCSSRPSPAYDPSSSKTKDLCLQIDDVVHIMQQNVSLADLLTECNRGASSPLSLSHTHSLLKHALTLPLLFAACFRLIPCKVAVTSSTMSGRNHVRLSTVVPLSLPLASLCLSAVD